MPALSKILFLFFLFLIFNIFLIFYFNHKNYFYSQTSEIKIEQKEEYKLFRNIEYKYSEFKITKENGLTLLSGLFMNESIFNKLLMHLGINKTGQVSYNEEALVNLRNLNQLKDLVFLLKNYFNDESSITVKNDEIILSGFLKNNKYKALIRSSIASIGKNINLTSNIFDGPEYLYLDDNI